MRAAEDKDCSNYGSRQEISSGNYATNFEFHRGNGAYRDSRHQIALGKPTPSKWDDAQKWLAGLSRGRDRGNTMTKPRNSNFDDNRFIAPVPPKEDFSSSSGEIGEGRKMSCATAASTQDEGETKKVDCHEPFWRINKPSEDSSLSIQSVSVRDMGTEMTPIASQEPSRTGTPIRATTPQRRSPISSRSSSPVRYQQGIQSVESYHSGFSSLDHKNNEEIGSAIRWSNKEEQESNARKTNQNKKAEHAKRPNPLETRAIAWDEAERAKFMARYKREEVKIQAWENHEKRKAEMEMRRMEVKAERLKSRAQEKLTNKLTATRRIAEEKCASAESKLNEQVVRTSDKADYIRRTGHLPSSFSFKLPSLCCVNELSEKFTLQWL